MLAVCGTVELRLDVDAGRSREGEAMTDVDVSLGWGRERLGLRVDGSGIGWFYGGVCDFADGLLELGRGEGFRSGQGGVALESESVDGSVTHITASLPEWRKDTLGVAGLCGKRGVARKDFGQHESRSP